MKLGTTAQRQRLARLLLTHRRLAGRAAFLISEGVEPSHPLIQGQGAQHLAVLAMIEGARASLRKGVQ